jgi:2-dehydropantoate 2-reductase
MRILVFGAGSLGCAMGGILAQKHEVVLVGRRENMDAIKLNGLRLTGEVEATVNVETRESAEGLEAPDLMILTTKAYHTKSVVDALTHLPWNDTPVLTIQNGLGNLELIRAWKGSRAFGGTTTMGASLLSPGNVRISGFGRTVIGSDMDALGANRLAEAFSACGLIVDVKADVASEIWAKAIVNACINPLTAILRVPNGKLVESETISRLMSELCDECAAVAESAGVVLPDVMMIDWVRAVAEDTAENRSSMLRDVELGRRTEISQMNGMICRIGSHLGVRTPLNRAMAAMVEALEPGVLRKG